MPDQDDDTTTTVDDETTVHDDDTTTTDDAPDGGDGDTSATADTTATGAGKPDPRDVELAAVKQEAARRRVQLRDLQAEVEKLRAANASAEERAILAAKQEAAKERDAALRPAVVRANARAALSAAGCTDVKTQTTMMRLLDPAVVELDDDGEVVGGLDGQIETLKAEFPEKFAAAKPVVPPARQVSAANKPAPAAPKTTDQLLVERLTGGTRQ